MKKKKPWMCGECKAGEHLGHDSEGDGLCTSIGKEIFLQGERYAVICNCPVNTRKKRLTK